MSASHPEQALQTLVAQWLDWALEPPAFYTAIPAGGGGELRGKILKGMGYKAGTPDLLFIYKGQARFIELKYGSGKLTESQEKLIPKIAAAGAPTAICWSFDEVRAQLHAWGLPLRSEHPTKTALRAGIASPGPFPPSDTIGRRKRLARPLDFR